MYFFYVSIICILLFILFAAFIITTARTSRVYTHKCSHKHRVFTRPKCPWTHGPFRYKNEYGEEIHTLATVLRFQRKSKHDDCPTGYKKSNEGPYEKHNCCYKFLKYHDNLLQNKANSRTTINSSSVN
jgi:hypothetical protein